jgi:hypothetical protein
VHSEMRSGAAARGSARYAQCPRSLHPRLPTRVRARPRLVLRDLDLEECRLRVPSDGGAQLLALMEHYDLQWYARLYGLPWCVALGCVHWRAVLCNLDQRAALYHTR